MNTKILLIGQAPPAVKQGVPYDTTMLYEWLNEIGISKEKAQDIFEFEAISNVFPGFGENGHLKPSKEEMDLHWDNTLELKVSKADVIILLGNASKEYFYSKPKTYSCNTKVYEVMHPSKRNLFKYRNEKEKTLNVFRNALKLL